ncbi:MAG TPA: PmoA family protein [Candidatus Hydrogenedentes bacterium]|nr:PmoA family protein [Candidatus Hydrogenedentota bacterium]
MRIPLTSLLCTCLAAGAFGVQFSFDLHPDLGADTGMDLLGDGGIWLRTMTTPLNPERREETYKVYTHIFDLQGTGPITKGSGGEFSHHRGLFIGWNHTNVGGAEFDTWHMKRCTQNHAGWQELVPGEESATQVQVVEWRDEAGLAFIREIRSITASPGPDGSRLFDFQSVLVSLRGTIQLRGDLQHAGMQVRMANEVNDHQDTTNYLLPEGVVEQKDNRVEGAWWVCCSPVVGGTRYWLMHMTPPGHPTGVPVYSIRRYARFGAFFEPDLKEGEPLTLNFRILLSDRELDQARCQLLYDAYAAR